MLKKKQILLNKSLDLSNQPMTPKPLDLSILKPSPYAIKDLNRLKQKIETTKNNDEKK